MTFEMKTCSVCRGSGQYCTAYPKHFSPCWECHGTGKVRTYSELIRPSKETAALDDDRQACTRKEGTDVKHYAKKRESVRAARWTGKMMPDVAELIDQRKAHVDTDQQLVFSNEKGPGRFARVGDWIMSDSGEDLTVIGDEQFRKIYEEIDECGRSLPTDEEIEAAAKDLVDALDVLLVAGLRLSREEHPDIFRARDRLKHRMRHLFDDVRHTAMRHERQRIRKKIAEELTP